MRFRSTRGGVTGATFEEALSRGYAPDGGLYVPEQLPNLSSEQLNLWRKLDFPSLQEEIMKLFVGDELSAYELSGLVHRSYESFSHKDIVPLVPLQNAPGAPVFIAELFHGPTFCFKDLGQQVLVRLLARFAERSKVQKTFLVSTTGDTGPAAMRAVADAKSSNLKIVVFYPEGQISELQRRQMTTRAGATARVISFQGGGDDMDLPLKRLGADNAFAERHGLCGINSYNLGRPVAQLAHYFWSYFRALDRTGAEVGAAVDIVVPSGALGNLAAAFMALKMGLPLRRLVAGVNANDITHRTITKGEFHRSECMEKTLSDAINIQVPYNMERIFYYLVGEDCRLVASWMAEMDRSGFFTLPSPWLQQMQAIFSSARVDDAAMCAATKRASEKHGYLPCPHTAVALGALWSACHAVSPPTATVVLATASPCKFEASVTEAVGSETWKKYQDGPTFPSDAREVLAARETPPRLFAACSTLTETQDCWEAQVREIMDRGQRLGSRAAWNCFAWLDCLRV
mmetsp:Transcript_9224/g.16255  ORF Transcript_9224/g.16255 Transcript_9224/m.16255 type:complete len:515 (+) Transcript_9224:87-1631(+)